MSVVRIRRKIDTAAVERLIRIDVASGAQRHLPVVVIKVDAAAVAIVQGLVTRDASALERDLGAVIHGTDAAAVAAALGGLGLGRVVGNLRVGVDVHLEAVVTDLVAQVDASAVASREVAADLGAVLQRDGDLVALGIDAASAMGFVAVGVSGELVVGDFRALVHLDARSGALALDVGRVHEDAGAVGLAAARDVAADLRVLHLDVRRATEHIDAAAAADRSVVRDLAVGEVEVSLGAVKVDAAAMAEGPGVTPLVLVDDVMGYGAVIDRDGRIDQLRADAAAVAVGHVIGDFAAVLEAEHSLVGVCGDSSAHVRHVVDDVRPLEDDLGVGRVLLGADSAAVTELPGVAHVAGERHVDELEH